MTCPLCAAEIADTPIVRQLTACGTCHRTLVLTTDGLLPATSADTLPLTSTERQMLVTARALPKRR